MPPSAPPRRFAPTPIEQTVKSSRQQEADSDGSTTPRRFAPEPIEETTTSSKDSRQQEQPEEKPKPRRFTPQPVEETVRSSKDAPAAQEEKPKARRFAPQMVEDTHKSSKDREHQPPKSRRFAPQVVEETSKSSKDKSGPEKHAHVKFKPEPVSMTYGGNRNAKNDGSASTSDVSEKKHPRKFTPVLLDTARRTRRAGDGYQPLSQADRTEYAYHLHSTEHWKRVTAEPNAEPEPDGDVEMKDGDSISAGTDTSSQLRERCALDGSAPRKAPSVAPARQHSFRMPDLDTIESSESEQEPSPKSPSPRRGDSPATKTESSSDYFRHATRKRESIDESFTHYLLDIERKKARQRLEEQALAAFPNVDFGYEPPDHYINNDDDSEDMEVEDRPVTWDPEDSDEEMQQPRREWHRKTTTKMSWEQLEMQRHAEQLQQERNANKTTAKASVKQPTQGPWGAFPGSKDPQEGDHEVKSMRDRARPPMLGKDLQFPRSHSPEPARFDVTQGSAALRNQMCYLTNAADAERKKTGEDEGLWKAPQAQNNTASTTKSNASSSKKPMAKGLWGGFCADDGSKSEASGGLAPPAGPTGLMTPQGEGPNPFDLAFTEGRPIGMKTPSTPATPNTNIKTADMARLNAALISEREFEAMMDREYPDSFITQVYNYLSLGYPSLARPFDEELSKISKIPIAELRQDDQKAKNLPRGYIRLGPDFEGGDGEGITEDSCMRWQALKKYVREWARQEKNMVKTDGLGGNWGTGARRGSWAI